MRKYHVRIGRRRKVVIGKHRTNLGPYLKDHGITQAWLAGKLEITEATMSRIANGKTLPGLRMAQTIADILGVSTDYLWPLKEAKKEDST